MLSKFKKFKKVAWPPLSSDIYLVSYPKSGNTWLRYLLSNCIIKYLGSNREVNWFNLQEFIPDIDVNNILPLTSSFSELPRIIKSHAEYNPHYLRVIYLVRNPVDVVESYYYYNKNFEKYSDADFLNSRYGIEPWLTHIESWSKNPRQGQIVKFIKYEDLVLETEKTISYILSIIGIPLSEVHIKDIVTKGSKTNMANDDKNFNSDMRRFTDSDFIREKDSKDEFQNKFAGRILEILKKSDQLSRIEFIFEKEIEQVIYG